MSDESVNNIAVAGTWRHGSQVPSEMDLKAFGPAFAVVIAYPRGGMTDGMNEEWEGPYLDTDLHMWTPSGWVSIDAATRLSDRKEFYWIPEEELVSVLVQKPVGGGDGAA